MGPVIPQLYVCIFVFNGCRLLVLLSPRRYELTPRKSTFGSSEDSSVHRRQTDTDRRTALIWPACLVAEGLARRVSRRARQHFGSLSDRQIVSAGEGDGGGG